MNIEYNGTSQERVSTGAAVARTRRSLGHHLLHPQILRLLVLLKPADFEAQRSLLKNRLHLQIQIPTACPDNQNKLRSFHFFRKIRPISSVRRGCNIHISYYSNGLFIWMMKLVRLIEALAENELCKSDVSSI